MEANNIFKNKEEPIITSLLDTDFYKLLMLQFIWKFYPNTEVTFSLFNRRKELHLSDKIDEFELRSQLDHARSLKITDKEKKWLTNSIFYGKKQLFKPEFLSWLSNYKLPEYDFSIVNGEYIINFHGLWKDVTLWEISSLIIINELYSRKILRPLNPFVTDLLYANAKIKLWSKIVKLRNLKELKIADFGTRRRHALHWQTWCIKALHEGIKDSFIGTSNVLLAMKYNIDAVGTSAHELPMVAAAITNNDTDTRNAPYEIMQKWNKIYDDNLLIALPDSFGTDFFLENAPSWIAKWKGFRHDSASPIEGGEKIIAWWKKMNCDPKQKTLIFSDNLDFDSIIKINKHFKNRVQMIFGWGTNLTNDFHGCMPYDDLQIEQLQTVCKVIKANNKSAVKLSDDPIKKTGDENEIKRYLKIFKKQG
ncbi:nicotinate phosphoribosyltransferase [Candidatus Liberibacter americanus]|uniref:Nicotinate phosphoribosyltransferase n=1 Tax=Candidatus Liberibacter americanus str. Sao Paulo TaxID=1261131 RepID=U6B3G6_9HYPH|nr:nicotinate phosphoribosyltransferase [Candidatus Liberibacter americanus]AHA27465.1 Nicotinic acid phosphoribosyltransferase [Candidatus Liberibacter americanus str. Sao Paulo]EMS36574.1 nicotinate phosphoribosyltransferase [Candidatus Liberibacter americanus PW_SP]